MATTTGSTAIGQASVDTWLSIGKRNKSISPVLIHLAQCAGVMDDWDRAVMSLEAALRHNPGNSDAITALVKLLISRDQFLPALELMQRTGHCNEQTAPEQAMCLLGLEEIGRAQSVLASVTSDEEARRAEYWFALGLYHDRVDGQVAAIDAFQKYIQVAESGDQAMLNEAYYRLAVLFRLQGRLGESRACIEWLKSRLPPRKNTNTANAAGPSWIEVAIQGALLDEIEGLPRRAKSTLERLLLELSTPQSSALAPLVRCRGLLPRLKQRLGCLALSAQAFENDSVALGLLLKATEEDPSDALNWYYLGRLYLMLGQAGKAYDAYQQAVYRDGRNLAFWNSIGNLYTGTGQFRDALDAYTRAVHYGPNIGALWYNLGLLYEACNGVGCEDAREALSKAALLGFNPGERRHAVELDAAAYAIRGSALFPRPPCSGRILGRAQQMAAMRRPPISASAASVNSGTGMVPKVMPMPPAMLIQRRS